MIKLSKKPGRYNKKRLGQMSILIIFTLIPMFTLLAFVVNLGSLVNAKISLQNAADLAAYAGAATQARQMTGISHLNYMMRQTYKKFLYRYYVIGNYALKFFPHTSGNTSPGTNPPQSPSCPAITQQDDFSWINPGSSFPGVPAVCLDISTSSNPCQLGTPVPLVTPPNCLPMTPICNAIQTGAQAIQDLQKTACGGQKLMNTEVALHWLYSTALNDPITTQPALSPIAQGLGLVPENLFHYSRIKTLEKYINEPPKTVTKSSLQGLIGASDQALTERSVLAFKTIQGNLNASVFEDENSIEMKELQPAGLLQLKVAEPSLDIPVVLFDGSGDQCKISLATIGAKPKLAVYKEQTGLDSQNVFYSVKLTAKARVLFNPFPFRNPDSNGITLTAYSAAQPFGSRIGEQYPDDLNGIFYKSKTINLNGSNKEIHYPFLRISNDSPEQTYEKYGVLSELSRMVSLGTLANNISTITYKDVSRGLLAAQLPDEYEIGKFNIPNDAEAKTSSDHSSGMVRLFLSGAQVADLNYDPLVENSFYQLWAPLVAPGETFDALKATIKTEIENNVSFITTGGSGNAVADLKAGLAQHMLDQIDGYFGALKSKNNFNIARIYEPLASAFFDVNTTPPPTIPGKVFGSANNLAVAMKLATSYTTNNDEPMYRAGRDGYSVKFIPMKTALSSARQNDLKGEGRDVVKVPY